MSRVTVVHDPWCADHEADGEICASYSVWFGRGHWSQDVLGQVFLVGYANEPTAVALDVAHQSCENLSLAQAAALAEALERDPAGLREALTSLLALVARSVE